MGLFLAATFAQSAVDKIVDEIVAELTPSEDALVLEFHKAGLWTPDEIHETVASSPLMREFPNRPQTEMDASVRAALDYRFHQERRGTWLMR